MISVVISALNPGRLGVRAVRSCLLNLPREAEVLLHLDPGEDDQGELFRSIKDSRFRLIETEQKIGFAMGLNFLISESKFDLVARLDADDLALPWRWRYQLSGMQNADFHFGSLLHLVKVSHLPILIPHFPVSLNSEEFSAVSSFRNPGFHPAVMFRKSAFFELGGYRPSLAEDYDLWLRASARGFRIFRGKLPVTIYRHHSLQATAKPNWQNLVERDPFIVESIQKHKAFLRESGLDETEVIGQLKASQPLAKFEFRDLASR